MKPTASCEAAQLWVRAILPPHIVPRRGTDASPMMLRKIVGPASRNQERVRGSLLVPQLRSFGACSGFQIDTCPIGTRRSSYCHTVTEYCRFNHLSCHANIVQRVKSCYKIKIDSRESKSCFYGVLLCKQHPRHTIEPLLHCESATIRQ